MSHEASTSPDEKEWDDQIILVFYFLLLPLACPAITLLYYNTSTHFVCKMKTATCTAPVNIAVIKYCKSCNFSID